MSSLSRIAELVIGLHEVDAIHDSVHLRARPSNEIAGPRVRGTATFDLAKVQAAERIRAEAVVRALTDRLFSDPAVPAHCPSACAVADTSGAVLRARPFIDPMVRGPSPRETHA